MVFVDLVSIWTAQINWHMCFVGIITFLEATIRVLFLNFNPLSNRNRKNALMKEHGCLPRDVYTIHLDELKQLMTEGVPGAPKLK